MRRFSLAFLTVICAMALVVALQQAQQWAFGPMRCEDGVVIPGGATHDFCASHGGSLIALARSLGATGVGALILVGLGFAWQRLRRRS